MMSYEIYIHTSVVLATLIFMSHYSVTGHPSFKLLNAFKVHLAIKWLNNWPIRLCMWIVINPVCWS